MDEEVRRIKEKWDKSGSIYDRSVTEAQVNIWTLLSRLKELEEGIEKHKKKYEIVEMFDEKIVKRYITREDEELYKLIEKEK